MNIEWRPDTSRNEITLLVEGERRGAIIGWKERSTGNPIGWTGLVVTPGGIDREISGDNVFWESEITMKYALLKELELVPREEMQLSPRGLPADHLAALLEEIGAEVRNATAKWPPFNSAHEGYAVLREEVDELWEHVKTNQKRRDLPAMRAEALQVAAMALRFAAELCDEERGRK